MLRKIATGFVLLTTSTLHAGFYAGAGIGPDTVDYKTTAHVVQLNNLGNASFDVINRSYLSGTGVFGTLFAGYAHLYKKFYLAAEANANFSSTSTTLLNEDAIHASTANTHITMINSLGISALPGYQFLPGTLFYGRLGYTNALVKVISSDVSLGNQIKRRNGFRYGVGIKQAITDRVALRMDYSRINYGSLTLNTETAVSKQTTIRPTQQLVEFGVVVAFG